MPPPQSRRTQRSLSRGRRGTPCSARSGTGPCRHPPVSALPTLESRSHAARELGSGRSVASEPAPTPIPDPAPEQNEPVVPAEPTAPLPTGLLEEIEEKLAHRRTTLTDLNVKGLRERTGLTQADFSQMIGVSIRTLQNWEQGRREPEGPAKALLRVVERNPQAVLSALHA